ncbi:hydroxyacid dehydrogenase [Candidatus Parcubacteria bacterium]|jgi:D-lactate dehydrogenase|nr:hydroxyacid dehydrogenase [Candidatus Parcubacteria bacterium]
MPKLNISFLETEKWEQKYLEEKLSDIKNLSLNFFSKPLTKAMLPKIKNSDVLAVFIYSQVDKQIIDQLSNLKFITTMSTGFDHIDLETCRSKKIPISNVPFYGENTVAEHTMALMLSLSRHVPRSIEKMKNYDFDLSDVRGFDLKGKTLGIVGLGHIGQHVARMAKGFEMKVIVADTRKDAKLAKQLGIKYVSLEKLLANSDVISLHAPYNKKTHHLINKGNIKLIKKGACLINTARGGLVETQALITALDKKIISCAGLDVLEEECFIKEEKELLTKPFQKSCDLKTILQGHLLIQDPRVLVTPHNAFNSDEALQRILDTTIDNIKAFIKNKHINKVK